MALPQCPKCQSEYTYEDGDLLICPECGHEWKEGEATEETVVIKDAHGNLLADGDRVTVIRILKLKGLLQWLKSGLRSKIFVYYLMRLMDTILTVKLMALAP